MSTNWNRTSENCVRILVLHSKLERISLFTQQILNRFQIFPALELFHIWCSTTTLLRGIIWQHLQDGSKTFQSIYFEFRVWEKVDRAAASPALYVSVESTSNGWIEWMNKKYSSRKESSKWKNWIVLKSFSSLSCSVICYCDVRNHQLIVDFLHFIFPLFQSDTDWSRWH